MKKKTSRENQSEDRKKNAKKDGNWSGVMHIDCHGKQETRERNKNKKKSAETTERKKQIRKKEEETTSICSK